MLRQKQICNARYTADHHRKTRFELAMEHMRRKVHCLPYRYAYDCCFMFFHYLHLSSLFQNQIIACFLFHQPQCFRNHAARGGVVVSWCRGTVQRGREFSFNLHHHVFSSPRNCGTVQW